MTIGRRFRQTTAALLMLAGTAMLLRGAYYSMRHRLGWQGLVTSGIVGALVFVLGLSRWRFLRKEQ